MALLERSIRFRHRRLAVLRLCDAMESGAPVPEAQWRYCLEAMPSDDLALRARDETLSELMQARLIPRAQRVPVSDEEHREAIAGVKADLQRLLDERTGY